MNPSARGHVSNVSCDKCRLALFITKEEAELFFYHLIFGKRCIFTLGGVHGRTLGVLPLHLQKQS
jgi:hypothetical protein